MRQPILTYFLFIFLLGCSSERDKKAIDNDDNKTVRSKQSSIDTLKSINDNEFKDFPIPILDLIFPFHVTSGAVGKSPSKTFYNPSDSGIYVFYSLLDRQKLRSNAESMSEVNIGTLITHTFRKPGYGWSEKDKDQTFIQLKIYQNSIKIGNSIQVGKNIKEVELELGKPIYQSDSNIVFLGKNNIIGSFNVKNNKIISFTYGRYNLPYEIFKLDSLKRKELIQKIFKGK